MFKNIEYYDWYGDDTLEMGCDFGGGLVYEPSSVGADLTLDNCEFTDGVPVSGTGALRFSGSTSLTIQLPFADLVSDGRGAISGTFRGQPVG